MIRIITILLFCLSANAMELSPIQVATIRNAIYWSEGGSKAKYAYGVKSVPYRNLDEAKRICDRSIRNNYARWLTSGRTNDFIAFFSRRYCPLDASNWTRNVKFFCKKAGM
ncbi:MAG: hypothetical protein KGL39_10070 [Patescibacteria group bacterium]|nr:hypothetical protein [Patescibacteria group bacterium]